MATDYDGYDALLHHIYLQTQGDAWFKPVAENISSGVCLRTNDAPPAILDTTDPSSPPPSPQAHYRLFPYENRTLAPFEAAVRLLNSVVAVKIRSAAVHAALALVEPSASALFVDPDTRIQVLPTMSMLPRADKEQCAAFIRDERVLVVWSDSPDALAIIPSCRDFEERLISLLKRATFTPGQSLLSTPATSVRSGIDITAPEARLVNADSSHAPVSDKEPVSSPESSKPAKKGRSCWGFGRRYSSAQDADLEKSTKGKERKTMLYAPFYNGLGLALSIYYMGSGLQTLLGEWRLDGSFMRFALVATMPCLFCISLFFSLQIAGNLGIIFGPIAHYHENSKYYSAVKPEPNPEIDMNPPHVTIQMPVYKESLEQVIAPSVESLKKAMQTYARQGGTSTIFINDDGMQLLSPADRAARQAFYKEHGIGWVARPKHSDEPDGFKRPGRFKKASNMNYSLELSLKLEKHLIELQRTAASRPAVRERNESLKSIQEETPNAVPGPSSATSETSQRSLAYSASSLSDVDDIEDQALQLAMEETFEETGRRWRPWASNGRAIRMGQVVLIVDSDTIVPEDCLRDAARELAESPQVAIIQHESGVMQVAHHWFEHGIAFFTRRINKCISMTCANGDVAPFVGHNAFLRWEALQDAAFIDPVDGKKKIWSEANVSEDFDMALRLQLRGYVIRWATYANGGFKEGVSLTVDDELNRWQKYAYGCNELIFNPLVHWWRKGPITAQLRKFIWCGAPIHYKVSALAYMFSYYGLAAGFSLTLLNYAIIGLQLQISGFYLHSFEIWLACVVVFTGSGNIAFTCLEYRLGHRSLLASLAENIKWIPYFFFFFGGLSIHLTTALLSHLFSYNMTWQATKKEVERSNFFIEVPRIWNRFKTSFIISFIVLAGMVILSSKLVPLAWSVPGTDWSVIVPLAIGVGGHILFPIVLNPWLMVFSY